MSADEPRAADDGEDLLAELTELLEALDRRAPSVARASEAGITRDAAALRAAAKIRIAKLKAKR
jgi:hypothetical protein